MPIRDGVFGSVIVLMARELVKKEESEGRLFDIIGQPALVVLLKPETPSPLVQRPPLVHVKARNSVPAGSINLYQHNFMLLQLFLQD